MRQIIKSDSSEIITVDTHKDRLSIITEFKGYLPDEINRYKVMVFNKKEMRRLLPIAHTWLNGGLK